jgi:hypothetical protein
MRYLRIMLAAAVFVPAASVQAQRMPAGDPAERMSGAWTINRDLSPLFTPSGRPGGRGGGAAYAIGFGVQRGRSNGPGPGGEPTPSAPGDLTPAERAEQDAMHQIAQIAPAITITATAGTFSIVDQRGEQTCAIDDRSAKLDMFGAKVGTKCRWDKGTVHQEFVTTRTKLTRTWSMDEAGHLVVKTRMEGLNQRPVEAAAVYDRRSS